MKLMTDEFLNMLILEFKARFPHGDVPNKFYKEFVTFVYANGAVDSHMDDSVFQNALQALQEKIYED